MHRRAIRLTVVATTAVLLGACATAGNEILVFGTDTKVGISIAGDPTGAPDFTLGYRRREAVWLPVSVGGGGIPTHLCAGTPLQCATAEPAKGSHICVSVPSGGNAQAGDTRLLCEEAAIVRRLLYVGSESSNGGKDAYSVIANFGLQTGTTDGTQIAQYIATGMAARALAAQGGEKLVRGGNLASTVSAEVQARNRTNLVEEDAKIDRIIVAVTDMDGKLNDTKRQALLAKAKIPDAEKKRLSTFRTAQQMRTYLEANFDGVAKPLADATN